MQTDALLTIVATDRSGLVQTVAAVVSKHGGNWVDSSLTRLGGEFAGIVRVTIEDSALPNLADDLAELKAEGIDVSLRKGSDGGAPKGRRARFELTGGDHPGIVRDISAALTKHSVSIDDLQTEVFVGSMSGDALFSAKANIVIPDDVEDDTLRAELEEIAHDIMVEFELTSA